MGRLSTHILDTVKGGPAAGVTIELHRLADDAGWTLVKKTMTNADGRTDEPLLADGALEAKCYMLTFHIGDYFVKSGASHADKAFLDIVPVRFTIADPGAHYHVPLLASP